MEGLLPQVTAQGVVGYGGFTVVEVVLMLISKDERHLIPPGDAYLKITLLKKLQHPTGEPRANYDANSRNHYRRRTTRP